MSDPVGTDRIPPPPPAPFSAEIRRMREARGLTRKALSRLAGIDPSTMTRLENGERGPSQEVVVRLAEALDASLGETHALLHAAGFLTDTAAELLDEPEVARLAALLARRDLAPDHRSLVLRHLRLALDLAAALGYEVQDPMHADEPGPCYGTASG